MLPPLRPVLTDIKCREETGRIQSAKFSWPSILTMAVK